MPARYHNCVITSSSLCDQIYSTSPKVYLKSAQQMSPSPHPEATEGPSSNTTVCFYTTTQPRSATLMIPVQAKRGNGELTGIVRPPQQQQQQQDPHHDYDSSNKPPHAPLLADPDSPPPYGSIAACPAPSATCNCSNHRLPSRTELRRAQWHQRSPAEQTCVSILIGVGVVFCVGIALFMLLTVWEAHSCSNPPGRYPRRRC